MQTGQEIADIGPDLDSTKWELKEIGGKQFFVDPTSRLMQPALAQGQYDWKASADLAKEYQGNQVAKDFMQVANQVSRLNQMIPSFKAGKISSGIFDIAIIKTMEKMLDPNSVVREGEFDNYLNAAGIWDKAKNIYQKYVGGAKIPEATRDALIEAIMKQYDAAIDVVRPLQESYMTNIGSVNADPVRVFGGFMVTNPETYGSQNSDDFLKSESSGTNSWSKYL
jgi:hypothetical protein